MAPACLAVRGLSPSLSPPPSSCLFAFWVVAAVAVFRRAVHYRLGEERGGPTPILPFPANRSPKRSLF